ncbi:hypothetical protein S83_035601, partial [Arachis hypogaea]
GSTICMSCLPMIPNLISFKQGYIRTWMHILPNSDQFSCISRVRDNLSRRAGWFMGWISK